MQHRDGRVRIRRRSVRRLWQRLPRLAQGLAADRLEWASARASIGSWFGLADNADAFRLSGSIFAQRDAGNIGKRLLVQRLSRFSSRPLRHMQDTNLRIVAHPVTAAYSSVGREHVMRESPLFGPDRLSFDKESLADFCRRWKIRRLEVFGSLLRQDFGPQSDLDLLVSFWPEAQWSLFDHQQMTSELAAILGREVDLVSRYAVERSHNWIRRRAILDSSRPFYDA